MKSSLCRIKKIIHSKNIGVCALIISIIIVIIVFIIVLNIKDKKQGEVEFKNSAFKEAVEISLNKECITEADIKKAKSLTIENVNLAGQWDDLHLFESLEELYIHNCNLGSIDEIYIPVNLKVLDCSNNKITTLSTSHNSDNYSKLEKLVLDNNPVVEMKMDLFDFTNMKELSMKECKLSGNIDLGNLPNLEILYLNNNTINAISGYMPKILTLNIDGNSLKDIESLAPYTTLKELHVEDNLLTSVAQFTQFPLLEVLYIRDNEISNVKELEDLKKLNSIYLDKEIDRKELDFMYDNWKNGDRYTKQYFLEKRYNLNEENKK